MKKKSTLVNGFFGRIFLTKGLVIVFLFSSLFFVGCYEWSSIFQPTSTTINSYFNVTLTAKDDGNPDNDWTNEDLIDYGLFGVMIPEGWDVQDSIAFDINCSDPSYDNSGILVYDAAHSQTLEDSIPSPNGYYWWGAKTVDEASMIYFESLSLSPRIYTGDQEGEYFLRYAIGDMDYWDRNPADDVSDPMPITVVDNTGIEVMLSNANISMYPNPVTDQLNIEFDSYQHEVVNMEIVDITGRIVKRGELVHQYNVIRLDGMERGVYFVKLSNGTTSNSHKILVN